MRARGEALARGSAHGLGDQLTAGAAAFAASAALVFRPFLLVPVAAGLALAGLAFAAATAALLVLLTARNVTDVAAESTFGAGLNAGALVGVLALGVALLRLARVARPRGILPTTGLLVALAVWYFVGVEAYGPHDSLLRELMRFASLLAVGLIALNAVDVREPTTLAGVVVAAGVPPALVAVFQFATGAGFEGSTRAYGTLGHPNAAAALFGICLATAVWKLVEEGLSRRYLVAAALFSGALFATQSLGGVARILVTLLAYAVLAGRLSRRARTLAGVAAVFAVAFALSPAGSSRVQELGTTASLSEVSRGWQTNSFDWRLVHWLRLLDQVGERPLVGHGLGTTFELVAPDGFYPHSDPLRILLETGVVGLVVFGGAFVALWAALLRRCRAPGLAGRYAAFVTAVVAGLTVHALVDNIHSHTAAMYAAAVLVASALVRTEQGRRPGP